MEKRRFKTIRGNVDLYVFLVFLAALCHLRFPDEFSSEFYFISIAALSYLLIFFIGYKFGRFWALMAGVMSTGVWFLIILIYSDYTLFNLTFAPYLIARLNWLEDTEIVYGSFQFVMLFGAIGYFSAFLIDKIEDFLCQRDLCIEDLMPRGKTLIIERVGDWFKRLIMGLFLLQLDPDDKKGVTMRRIRKLFLIIVIFPLVSLFNFLSLQLSLSVSEFFTLNILPASLAPVIGLWIAYLYGVLPGVLISFSLILSPFAGVWLQEMDLSDILNYRFGVSPPDVVIALTVAAWIIGKVSAQLKDKAISDKLSLNSDSEAINNLPRLRLWNIGLLVVLAFHISFSFVNSSIHFDLMGVLIIYIIWLSMRYDCKQVSNVVLILFALISMLNMRIPLVSEVFYLQFHNFYIFEIVMLTMIPVLASRIKLQSLQNARSFMLWVLGINWVIYMVFLRGQYFPDFFISYNVYSQENYSCPIILFKIVGTFVLFELGSRFLWFYAGKTPQEDNGEDMVSSKI